MTSEVGLILNLVSLYKLSRSLLTHDLAISDKKILKYSPLCCLSNQNLHRMNNLKTIPCKVKLSKLNQIWSRSYNVIWNNCWWLTNGLTDDIQSGIIKALLGVWNLTGIFTILQYFCQQLWVEFCRRTFSYIRY